MPGEEPIPKRKSHEDDENLSKRVKLDDESKTTAGETPKTQDEESKIEAGIKTNETSKEAESEEQVSKSTVGDSNSANVTAAEEIEKSEQIPESEKVNKSTKSKPSPVKLERSDKKPSQESKAKFGASSFTINQSISTPLNSFSSSTSSTKETPTAPNTTSNSPKPTLGSASSPKPVFGATTSFGKSIQENLKNRKSVFDSIPSQSDASGEPKLKSVLATSSFGAGATSSFGSNSKFGNAFQESLKKKSFLDEAKDEANGTGTDEESDARVTPQQFKQVELEKIEHIQTGEEDEISRFTTTAKLFELDLTKIAEGWKERGLGSIHVNQSKNKLESRIVMRSNGLLRVILNYKITAESKLLKGLEASLTPGKFVRFSSVNASGAPIQYLLKLGSEKTRDELFGIVEDIKQEIKEHKETK